MPILDPSDVIAKQQLKALEKLVVLRYAHNECYVHAVSLAELREDTEAMSLRKREYTSLKVDTTKGTWEYDGNSLRIGKGSFAQEGGEMLSFKIIGIYDRTNLKHINQMLDDAREATR
jgi:hypothetical protein